MTSLTALSRPSFEMWMRAVDAHCSAICGLSSSDLTDCAYLDWYNHNVPAKVAAKRAIKRSKEG